MSTEKGIVALLLKEVSWTDVCAATHCGKSTVAKYAAKMRETGGRRGRLASMTDTEVSALFSDCVWSNNF